MGPVTNVVLFDKEPSGVASVRYSNTEAAEACVKVCSDPKYLLLSTPGCFAKDLALSLLFLPYCVHEEKSCS